VHGTGVYSAGVGPKGPALERFLVIKKKKKYVYLNFHRTQTTYFPSLAIFSLHLQLHIHVIKCFAHEHTCVH
jgi:hypothetical protein